MKGKRGLNTPTAQGEKDDDWKIGILGLRCGVDRR